MLARRSTPSCSPCARLARVALVRLDRLDMGRPDFVGASHANAMILLTCSAVSVCGAPGCGASSSRSSALNSSRGNGCNSSKRLRHRRTVSICTPSARTIWQFDLPAALARTTERAAQFAVSCYGALPTAPTCCVPAHSTRSEVLLDQASCLLLVSAIFNTAKATRR
jgi:hypothetical protein